MNEIQEIQENRVSGLVVKKAVKDTMKSRDLTKEQLVAEVQSAIKGQKDEFGDEITFSLAGLNRIYHGDLPARGWRIILEALARVCRRNVSDFAEPEAIPA